MGCPSTQDLVRISHFAVFLIMFTALQHSQIDVVIGQCLSPFIHIIIHGKANHCYSHQSILVSLLVMDRQIIATVTSQYQSVYWSQTDESLLQSPVNTSQSIGHGQTNLCYNHQSILVSLLVMDRQIIVTVNTNEYWSWTDKPLLYCYSHQSILVNLLVIDSQIIATVISQFQSVYWSWTDKSLLQSSVNTSQSIGHRQMNHCYSHQSILVSLMVMDSQIIATLLQSSVNTSQSIDHRQTNH